MTALPLELVPFVESTRELPAKPFDLATFLRDTAPLHTPGDIDNHPLKVLAAGARHVLFSTEHRPSDDPVVVRDHDVLLGVCTDGPAVVDVTIGGQHISTLRFDADGGFKYIIGDAFFIPTICVHYSLIRVTSDRKLFLVKADLAKEPRLTLASNAWLCGTVPFPFAPDAREDVSRIPFPPARDDSSEAGC